MKLAIAALSVSLSIAAPVFACPMENHDSSARTAEKAKDTPKDTAKADKAKADKPADKAKAADPAKPADKVSRR